MKFKNPLLVVTDMEASKAFYREVLGLRIIMDFDANVTLTGGICLQTKESWLRLIQAEKEEFSFCGRDTELYFEEDSFDDFVRKLSEQDFIRYVHPVVEHPWGQRVIRFYDPDGHMIEVGEDMKMVINRFLTSGMSMDEVSVKMGASIEDLNKLLEH